MADCSGNVSLREMEQLRRNRTMIPVAVTSITWEAHVGAKSTSLVC